MTTPLVSVKQPKAGFGPACGIGLGGHGKPGLPQASSRWCSALRAVRSTTVITRPPSSGPSPSEPDTSAYFPSAVTARPTGPKLPVGMIASTAFNVMLLAGSSALATLTTVMVPAWPCWKSAAALVVTDPE